MQYWWYAAQRCYVHKTCFGVNCKDTKVVSPICGHTTFVLLTLVCTMTIIDKIMIFCNNVNKTITYVELLLINIICYISCNVGLGLSQQLDIKPSWKSGIDSALSPIDGLSARQFNDCLPHREESRIDIMPLCIYSNLIKCFNKVIFLCFCNKLKFHMSSREGKMLGLSPGIKNFNFVKKWT